MLSRTASFIVLTLAIILIYLSLDGCSYSGMMWGHVEPIEEPAATLHLHLPDETWDGPQYQEPIFQTVLDSEIQPTVDATLPVLRKANATIVILARNGDLSGIVKSMSELEAKFNGKFDYPYVFLNEEPFTEEFKRSVTALTRSKIEFGLIPHDQWYQPDFIDEEKATAARQQMVADNVIYGGNVQYRNRMRFHSGFLHRHTLMQKYRYYWRVEPDVRFFCTLDYDPFLFMQDEDMKYGFTMALPEYMPTIPTLWDSVKEFVGANPELVEPDNALAFLSDDGGESHNGCQFWSNFEIADLDFWRGEAYTKFFEHLDRAGGFYYERWSTASVHSIGAALFARKDQIHFFNDIGYRHVPFQHCPQEPAHSRGKCECDITNNFDNGGWSCLPRFNHVFA
ncbi:glycosyltransferase family 15 protein [Mycena leptocephala]|nr:glycosyltransferase family 15 protein [Mycena leptocephala]